MTIKTTKAQVTCNECEAIYQILFDLEDTNGDPPQFCVFCGTDLDDDVLDKLQDYGLCARDDEEDETE